MLAAALATAVHAADATGTWKTQAGRNGDYLHVRIAPCGTDLCGTIDGAFGADGKAVPGYKYAGKKMIWDMTPDGTGKWSGGKIWSPVRDITASGKLALRGDTLVVSGCKGPICRSQDWMRAD